MKKFVSIVLTALIIAAYSIVPVLADAAISFTDVDASTEVGKSIYKLAEAGVINGNGDGTFAPQRGVSRAELCKMINLIKKYSEEDEASFSDVTTDKWYYSHVKIAKKAGYILGFEDGTFRGDSPVTREQACAIIVRVMGLYDLSGTETIADAVSPWAESYVKTIISNRLISLEAGNTFRATENMTRAELALLLAPFAEINTPTTDGNNGSGSIGSGSIGSGSTGNGSIGNGSIGNGSTNSGNTDSGNTDSGNTDSGNTDSGNTDSGDTDSGNTDSGNTDSGNTDSGNTDSGNTDSGNTDSGNTDSGNTDSGNTDNGSTDNSTTPDTSEEPDTPEFDSEKQELIVTKLNSLLAVLTDSSMRFDEAERNIINIVRGGVVDGETVVGTIQKTLADAQNGEWIYVEGYVKQTYSSDVQLAKSRYKALDETAQSAFYSKLATHPLMSLDDVKFLLKIMFGIDDPTTLIP